MKQRYTIAFYCYNTEKYYEVYRYAYSMKQAVYNMYREAEQKYKRIKIMGITRY